MAVTRSFSGDEKGPVGGFFLTSVQLVTPRVGRSACIITYGAFILHSIQIFRQTCIYVYNADSSMQCSQVGRFVRAAHPHLHFS